MDCLLGYVLIRRRLLPCITRVQENTKYYPLHCLSCAYLASSKENDKFRWEPTLYGFGYDPINEDYKVVKIVDYYGTTIDSLRITVLIKGSIYGVFANSAVQWTASTEILRRDRSPTMIVAFGFGVEGFRIIVKAVDFLANEHDYFDLGVLGGCLCLLCAQICSRVQIWAMKDSWSKLSTVVSELQVDRYNFYVRTLAYSKSEDKVLLGLDNTLFVWCDSRMRKSELVKIHGAPGVVATEIFVGSLVTLKNGGGGGKIDSGGTREKEYQE
ncbi:PREDICTED: F-box protein CPR30-like [Populus euphratica]|uniref:F-box protein CPR30-like n=1 Tax=Populus euphratica TaxID=75702 RepID=A0AAJ6T0W1_POPEU|nr:PREDICTED: F-box protein CPR30-like [Populus euphratica]